MKIMSKVKIIHKNSVKNIRNEQLFLSKLHNPFLVNMKCSFQDSENLYLVMDLLLGGDLRYHINKKTKFNEKQIKFIIACTIAGLEYLHENKILHKDIKPENLVFDKRGYIHITDLGISKIFHIDNGKENSGTPGYMAPEVLFNKNHNYCVDFFATGVMSFELLMGKRPYEGHDKKELRKNIITHQAKIKFQNMPNGFSLNAINFINALIQRKVENRLGYNGINEIKNHPWFLIDFNWEEFILQKMEPPFIPNIGDNFDRKYCEQKEEIGQETELVYKEIKNGKDYVNIFENYTFDGFNVDNKKKEDGSNIIHIKLFDKSKKLKLNFKQQQIENSKLIQMLKEDNKKNENNENMQIKKIEIINDKKYMNGTMINMNYNNKEKKDINFKKITKSPLKLNNKYSSPPKMDSSINFLGSSLNFAPKCYSKENINNNNINKYKYKGYSNKKIENKRFIDNNNHYKSIYASSSFRNFGSINLYGLENQKKIKNSKQLPIISKLKKSVSSGNYNKIDNRTKKVNSSENNLNKRMNNNILTFYSKYFGQNYFFPKNQLSGTMFH